MRPISFAITLGIISLFLTGCGSGGDYVSVSGVITLDGVPLAGAGIQTQPIGGSDDPNPGSGSWGKTDENGRFTLTVVNPAVSGAVVGEHRVTITQQSFTEHRASDERDPTPRPAWPSEYLDGSLRLTVPKGGTGSADFDLEPIPEPL